MDEKHRTACFDDDSAACYLLSLGDFLDRSGKVGHVEVFRCKRCGHGVSMPPLHDVGFLYENRASQDYQPDSKGLSHAIKDLAFRWQAKKLLKQIGHAKGSFLDFGCGSGQFTKILGEVARNAKVVGADIHADAPAELKGHRYLGPVELPDHRGKFDVVIALHVVEHDDDADGLLKNIASYARPGGKVVVEVPNIDCVWSKCFGKFWDGWYLPYHRHHFTRGSLMKMMQRNGLKVEAVHGITVPTMGRTFANFSGASNNLFWLLLGSITHPIQLAGEVLSGPRSAIRVIAIRNA